LIVGSRVNVVEEDDGLADFIVHHFLALASFNKQKVLVIVQLEKRKAISM
jgi:hypothetical protein